ncbi:MAG: hypothetical protein M1608_04450 [Candidatus Omnitrophica bacterium]|nr:hypothetical protein [Candidatus Omnitrophota bacterium]
MGPTEGAAVAYNWSSNWGEPGAVFALLPWLGIALLLMLKPNRHLGAWLIWLPLVALISLQTVLRSNLEFLPTELLDILLGFSSALALGLAAVWLAAGSFGRRYRFVTFAAMFGVLAGYSICACVIQQGWESGGLQMVQQILLLGLGVLVVSIAVSLTGLLCRGGYHPFAVCLWLILLIPATWLVVTVPFMLIAVAASGGRAPWLQLSIAVFLMAGICFVTLTPFMVLSFANSFHRERLKAILHLRIEAPAVLEPSPTAEAVGGRPNS